MNSKDKLLYTAKLFELYKAAIARAKEANLG